MLNIITGNFSGRIRREESFELDQLRLEPILLNKQIVYTLDT